MRTLIAAVVILALTAGALFLIVHFGFDGQIPGFSTPAASEFEDRETRVNKSGIPTPEEVRREKEAEDDVADQSDTSTDAEEVPATRGRTFYYSGILYERGRPFGGQELTLQTKVNGEADAAPTRSVYTVPKSGEFVLTLNEHDYPARLVDITNQLLVHFDRAPFYERSRLNVHIESPAWGKVMSANAITAIQTEDNCRILVYGQSELNADDDNQLITRLTCRGSIITEGLLPVDGGALIGDIETGGPLPFAGWYGLELAWRHGEATAAQKLELKDKGLLRPSQSAELTTKSKIYLGRKEDEEAQEKIIADYYEGAARDCRMIRGLICEVANKFRDAEVRIPRRDKERLRAYPLYTNVGLILKSSAFPKKRWRKFVDEQCQEVYGLYREDKVPFRAKYPSRATRVVQLFGKLNTFMRLESQLLYGALQEPLDHRDYVARDFPAETQWGMEKMAVDRFLEEFERLNRTDRSRR